MITLRHKINLIHGLLSGDAAKTGPFIVDIGLTTRCNLHCLGCPYHSPSAKEDTLLPLSRNRSMSDIPLDSLKQLCSDLKKLNTYSINITGAGEPMLHPDITEFVYTAKASGLHINLFTNGTLLNEESITSFIDAKMDNIRVSLWATSTEEYKLNYPGTNPAFFKKVMNNLKLITRLKEERNIKLPILTIYNVVGSNNLQSIDAMVDLAYEVGCNRLFFHPLVNHGEALTPYVLSQDEIKLFASSLRKARKRLNALSIAHNINIILFLLKQNENPWLKIPCYVSWYYSKIMTDGSIRPCPPCDLTFGNLHEKPFREIWNGPEIRAFRRQTFTCKRIISIGEYCNCSSCCFIYDNFYVNRFFRWFHPFASIRRMRNGKLNFARYSDARFDKFSD